LRAGELTAVWVPDERHEAMRDLSRAREAARRATAYIVVDILLEERDLVDLFGDDYRRYKASVSMLVPWRKSA
jgi:protein-S-isoprenylcysteine O-methyltransferase Ste14